MALSGPCGSVPAAMDRVDAARKGDEVPKVIADPEPADTPTRVVSSARRGAAGSENCLLRVSQLTQTTEACFEPASFVSKPRALGRAVSPSSAAVPIARSAPRVAPMRGKEVDEALSLAMEAAEALGAGELTGKDAHQLSRVCFLSDPTSRHDPTLTPLSHPFHPLNTGEELGWLDSVRDAVTTNLRPTDTAPTSPRSARSRGKLAPSRGLGVPSSGSWCVT